MNTKARWAILVPLSIAAAALSGPPACSSDDRVDPPEPDRADAGPDAPEVPTETAAIAPVKGQAGEEPFSCDGAYSLPETFTGPKGLAGVGWTLADLTNNIAWNVPNVLENNWITDSTDAHPSIRVRPHLAPEAGHCYKDLIESAASGAAMSPGANTKKPALGAVIGVMTGFGRRSSYYDELSMQTYTPHAYDLGAPDALVGALRGLYEKPNALPGAPIVPPWDEALSDSIAAAVELYPPAMKQAIARLVLSVGEAYDLKQEAIAQADLAMVEDVHDRFITEKYYPYSTLTRALLSPLSTSDLAAILAISDDIDQSRFHLAALAVSDAAEAVALALAEAAPIETPPLNVLTPHGRILVSTSGAGDTYEAEAIADAAVLVDLAGDDAYKGRYASTPALWMSASAVIDVRGNDAYNPELPDIEDPASTGAGVLDRASAYTQGAGLFGVGVLLDGAGDDTYRASAYAQGASAFGVGVLADYGGKDSYKMGIIGEGVGYFGLGLLLDAEGNDHYGAYMAGQGVGRPSGHGLLLDLGGDDEYIAYYNDDPPELPSPGYKSYYPLESGYGDAAGEWHHLSFCQGVGMGYRADWVSPQQNWAGGFGALLDLGAGTDIHYSDSLSMGQGFIYGFGFLYDGGGDDMYRAFWWAFGSGTHMGTGLMVEEGGDDDLLATRASATLGHDTGASFYIDKGGNDIYGGRLNFGLSLTNGMAFFIEEAGDDTYALPPDAAANPDHKGFGYVEDPVDFAKRAGIFMDLGGGNDTYQTARPEVKNGAAWVIPPNGPGADPTKHKGIGVDE